MDDGKIYTAALRVIGVRASASKIGLALSASTLFESKVAAFVWLRYYDDVDMQKRQSKVDALLQRSLQVSGQAAS